MNNILRKLLLSMVACQLCFNAFAQDSNDDRQTGQEDWYIYFKIGKSNLEEDYNNNSVTLQRFLKRVEEYQGQGQDSLCLAKVRIIGYASPDGPIYLNNRLSQERAESLKDYFSRHADLNDSVYEVIAGGENWNELKLMIESGDMKYKEEVLDIINNTPEGEDPEIALRKLPNGVYSDMIRNIFPKLRSASSVQLLRKIDLYPEPEPTEEVEEVVEDTVAVINPPLVQPCGCEPPLFGLRTNAAYWAVLLPNIGVEAYIGKRFSIAVDGTYRWFNFKGSSHNYTISTINGELRYWLRNNKTFTGSYFGLYGRYGEYDIKLSETGKMGYVGGGGISYGYVFSFKRVKCLFFELGASAGYDRLNYAKYRWIDECNAFIERKKCNHIGLTRVNASFIWRF